MWIFAVIGALVALSLLFLFWVAWSTSPRRYRVVSSPDLQRFFASWTEAVGDRRDIYVGTSGIPELIQFREKIYKSRPDKLVFRFRNADRTKQFFPLVVSALETSELQFDIELTRKRRAPRAAVVDLDAGDALLPSAASHLCEIVLEAVGHSLSSGAYVSCTGLKPNLDPRIRLLIPVTRGESAEYGLGFALGVLYARIRDWLAL